MIIRHVMKELLGVKASTEQQSQISIRRLDELCDECDSGLAGEGVFIRDTVFGEVGKRDV